MSSTRYHSGRPAAGFARRGSTALGSAALRSLGVLGALGLFASGAGCHGDCMQPYYLDLDGDGYGDPNELVEACERPETYVADARDCNDRAPNVHPDAPEGCNGIDDDCDGVIDPDGRIWYADLDGDGYGDKDVTSTACAQPDGFVDRPGDCDDSDAGAHPGVAVELCDGIDQDCDGLVDDGAEGTTMWYPDADFDGWGWELGGRLLCAPPAGWITRGEDCDDASPFRSPVAPEVCDGFDDDCDGLTDDADPSVTGQFTAYPDDDRDGYGDKLAGPQMFCFVPYGYATSNTDCDDLRADVHPNATEICGGGDEDCDLLVDDADPSYDETTAVDGWADADGDGYGDPTAPITACVLGADTVGNELDCDDEDPLVGPDQWLRDLDGDGAGAGVPVQGTFCRPPQASMVNVAGPIDCDDGNATIRPGEPDLCEDGVDQDCSGIDPACGEPLSGLTDLEDVARAWATGVSGADAFEVAAVGPDIDGDGVPDAVLGNEAGGDVLVFSGPGPELSSEWAPSLRIPSAGDGFGAALALVGDVDNDGVGELVVGVPDENGAGEVQLLRGPAFDTPALTVTGVFAYEAGAAVADAGDVDGDGFPDLVIGAPGGSRVAVVELEAVGVRAWTSSRLILTDVNAFGTSVACCSDLDGDGVGELVAGAPSGAGKVVVVDASLTGSLGLAGFTTAQQTGVGNSELGTAVGAGGDFDGDGNLDFASTAPRDDVGGIDAGVAFVQTAPGTGLATALAALTVYGEYDNAHVAQSIAIRDLDGDGVGDLVLGANAVDLAGPDSGGVFVVYGPAFGVIDASDASAVIYGPPSAKIAKSVGIGPIDADPALDLWISDPSRPGGGAWLVPGGL